MNKTKLIITSLISIVAITINFSTIGTVIGDTSPYYVYLPLIFNGQLNNPPTAVNDSFSTAQDTQLTVPAPGVLENDSDLDGDSLTAVLVSDPAHGNLTLYDDGSFIYTPDPSFTGSDNFTYNASDGDLESNTATVTLTITTVSSSCSSPPTLISPGNGSVPNTLIPTFQWDNGNVSEVTAIRFLLLLHEDDFPNTWVWSIWSYNWISEYTYDSQNLEPGTTYYWKVWHVCGETEGPHSEMWSFTTGTDGTIPAAPILISPANGSEIWSEDLPVILQWEEAIGAEQYYLEIYKWSAGTWNRIWARNVSGTQYTIPFSLTENTYYKWNVTSLSYYALGGGSPFWQFHTNY